MASAKFDIECTMNAQFFAPKGHLLKRYLVLDIIQIPPLHHLHRASITAYHKIPDANLLTATVSFLLPAVRALGKHHYIR